MRGLDELFIDKCWTQLNWSSKHGKITVRTISRYRVKAKVLLTEVHESCIVQNGYPRAHDDVIQKRNELDRISELWSNFPLNAPARSDSAEELHFFDRRHRTLD